MKKILFIIFMFTFINVTYAEECTEEKLKELKQIADNIVIDTEFYDKDLDIQMYDSNLLTIQGLTEGFYIYSDDGRYLYEYSQNGKIEDILTGKVEYLNIYNDICPNEVIRKVKLSLKTYNPYSQYKECEGISGDELDVCGKFYNKSLTEEEFIKKVNEYKESNKTTKEETKQNNTIYLIIIGSTIVILLIVILLIRRKRNILD